MKRGSPRRDVPVLFLPGENVGLTAQDIERFHALQGRRLPKRAA